MEARALKGYPVPMIVEALAWGMLSLATADDPLSEVPCAFAPAFFDPGSASLSDSAIRIFTSGYLQEFGVLANPRSEIILAGVATDGRSEGANRRLVHRREQAVRNFLISRGMRPERVRVGARERLLDEVHGWPLTSTHGRAVVIEVRIPNSDLVRVMPPGGPIC